MASRKNIKNSRQYFPCLEKNCGSKIFILRIIDLLSGLDAKLGTI